jgi:hypothetical protein
MLNNPFRISKTGRKLLILRSTEWAKNGQMSRQWATMGQTFRELPPLIVEFGECLRSIRQGLGYTVASLASASGFPGEYIEAVEVGHAELSIRSLAVMCEALGLSSAILFRKSGNPSG